MALALPVLKTERLILSVGDASLAPAVAAYLRDNRSYLAPWDPLRPDNFYSDAHWKDQLPRNRADFEMASAVRLLIQPRNAPNAVIGLASFTAIARGPAHFCFLGYSLAEKAQGHGYMTEALKAATAYMFSEWRMHRIMANYMPHNVRSGHVLRRLGFVVEGYARDYLQIAGKWEDHILTALINPDWQPVG
jgi:ribosomal-protein-alanine N-acetyltransferase